MSEYQSDYTSVGWVAAIATAGMAVSGENCFYASTFFRENVPELHSTSDRKAKVHLPLMTDDFLLKVKGWN